MLTVHVENRAGSVFVNVVCALRARMFFWFCIVDLRQTHVQVVCTVHDDDEMS